MQGKAVGPADSAAAEALRGLRIAQGTAGWNGAYAALFVHLVDGVGGFHGHGHGPVVAECGQTVADDALAHQGAHGVVQQQAVVVVGIGPDGRQARVVALLAAGQNLSHLLVAVSLHDGLHFCYEVLSYHYGYLVDAGMALKGLDAVLQEGLACRLQKLFGQGTAQSGAATAGQNHGYVHDFLCFSVCFFKVSAPASAHRASLS